MKTRRAFLKILLGLGAVILPWSFIPARWKAALETALGPASAKLVLPPEPEISDNVPPPAAPDRSALDDIVALIGKDMQGRKAGSVGETKAAGYLSGQLKDLGLEPMGNVGSGYAHVFTIPPVIEKKLNGRLIFSAGDVNLLRTPSANILGALRGENTEEIILLSAHYDHLGFYEGRLYPGANDNASGVGCILDVMRRILREGITPKRTIVLSFWSAEEMGFVGSQAFVQAPSFPLRQVKGVVNVDTIGNGKTGDFALWSEETNSAFQAVRQAAAEAGASAQKVSYAGHNSDSISFASAGIPAVTLLARDWLSKNHTPEDDFSLLKPEQIQLAVEIVYRAIHILAF